MTINRKHIDRVFSQRFSLFDLKMLEKYFEEEKLNEEVRMVVEEQWEQFEPDPGDRPDLEDVFFKLYYTIDNHPKKQAPRKPNIFLKMYRIAAVLLVGLLIAVAAYFSTREFSRTSNPQWVEIVSHDGFRSQFTLPDGTSGWLGYGSNLKYHLDNKDKRVVDLDGLAFFDVAHQKEHPFIVQTPAKLNVEVLGTRFNVSAYSKDRLCDVVLQEGSVKLTLGEEEIQTIKPNERVIFHAEDNSFEKSTVKNVDDFLAWKDGKLVLRDITLKEACMKLSHYYNVDFELQAKELDDMEIQLTLENETLESALDLLSLISPVSYKVEDRKVQNNQTYSKKKIIIKNR